MNKDFMDTYLRQISIYGKIPDEALRFLRYARHVSLGSDRNPHVGYAYSPGNA